MKENKELDQMKKEYQNIEVPEELKGRMEEAIKKAKMDKERERFMKKLPKRAGYGVVAAMLAITILANSGEQIAYAMEKVPVLGAISEIVTFREYKHKDGTMEADIKTPEIKGDSDSVKNLNQQIQKYTDQIKENYEKDLNQVLENYGDTKNAHESVQTGYTVISDNDTILSLQIQTTIAMAGSNSFSKFYTLDKRTGQILALQDLFKDGADYQRVLSENIISQMKEQMKQDKTKSYFLYEDDPDDPLNFKEIKKDQNFYIDKEGNLYIAFDKYEVAPGYMGECYFKIEFSVIKDIVKDNSVLNAIRQ